MGEEAKKEICPISAECSIDNATVHMHGLIFLN